jgi:haloalkane dehalogenase
MHYLDEGHGAPLVMLHGNPTWSFYFRGLVRALSPAWRVIVPDHIGCGLSAKPSPRHYAFTLQRRVEDLGALLDGLELEEPLTLILHDWGGMIGMAWAVAHPRRLARLVVLNTAAFRKPSAKPLPWPLHLLRRLGPAAVPLVLATNLFARAAIHMAPARPLAPAVRQGFLAPYDRPRHRWATVKFVQDIPLGPEDASYTLVKATDERLSRLKHVPTLICWGMRDFVFDGDYLAEWRRRFPCAMVHTFPHAGHYLLEDAGDQVAARIAAFLEHHTGVTGRSPT